VICTQPSWLSIRNWAYYWCIYR